MRDALSFNRRNLLLRNSGAAAALRLAGPALAQDAPAQSIAATPANSAGAANNEKKISIVTLRDLEARAQKAMTPPGIKSIKRDFIERAEAYPAAGVTS